MKSWLIASVAVIPVGLFNYIVIIWGFLGNDFFQLALLAIWAGFTLAAFILRRGWLIFFGQAPVWALSIAIQIQSFGRNETMNDVITEKFDYVDNIRNIVLVLVWISLTLLTAYQINRTVLPS